MKLFFFVVLLCASFNVVTAVDGCHTDRDTDHRVRLNCTGAGLSGLPTDLKRTTEVLLFPRNQFSSLPWESYQIFSKLYELDLTGNELGQVKVSTTPLLPGLSVLRLGHNRLTSLAGGAFSACLALTHLYLEDNAIESLSDNTFAGLSKLEVLDLTSNRIRVLPPLLLRPLVAIETLYLETNQISEVPDNWFNPREDVPYLYLSDNPWACYCSLMYLYTYLQDFSINFYVRDGKSISTDPQSLVCQSPQRSKGRAIVQLNQDDICPPTTPRTPAATATATATATTTTTTLAPSPTFWVTEGPDEESEDSRGDGAIFGRLAMTTSSTSLPDHSSPTTALSSVTTSTASLPTTESLPTTQMASLPATTESLPITPTAYLPSAPTAVTATSSEVPRTWGWDEGGATPLRHVPVTGVFCVWLFAGIACLCAMGAVSSLMTVIRLVVLYRAAYKPLRAAALVRGGGPRQVRLYGGTAAVYRSVLFVSREEEGDGPRQVYRTSLQRTPGTQVALQQWSDVLGERQNGEGGAGWRQRFSVLLRQEREGPDGRREERDWVVGAWLAQNLPSVTADCQPSH
ncbi:platelet glycoprotein Ib alpha chain isoform X2 [Syngnathus scovelli]|uniref:platelet glycoprotein Ib alpha chain isoform X2 n=1 Tax=Syngnathus scovelli TaxID=161590 RepID=UPI0021109B5C|nr:platelet glycoprotein Ib alpha chain isoform X2 [Syngnathus scovelli]